MRSVLFLTVALAGCGGASAEAVNTPSGRKGYTVECEDPSDCYAEAGRLCPGGYNILDAGQRTEDNRLANAFSAAGAGVSGATPQRHTKTKINALIECRSAQPRAALAADGTCSRAARTGVYEMRYLQREGTCGDMQAELARLRNADPDPPTPGCTVEADAWSPDGCDLERRIICQTANGVLTAIGRTRQNADGSVLSGAMAVRVTASTGQIACQSTYAVHAERKSP